MKTNQPRETTARFNTTECRLILQAMRAIPNTLLNNNNEGEYHKVVKRLEHRINTEDKKHHKEKNEDRTGNTGQAS